MAKLFIFGIGGTGERVMRSFTMLLAAGVPTFDGYNIYPVLIDYDKDNGDKDRVVKLLQNYRKINQSAYRKHGRVENQFFSCPLEQLQGLKNFVLNYEPKEGEKKFCEHIGFSNMKGDTLVTKHLLNTLYDNTNNPSTELNLDMTVGFKGNPNIGSVVFHKLREMQEYQNFLNACDPAQGDKVVIVGSLFGGTGASGIPELVHAIRKDKPAVELGTLLMLTYFSPANKRGDVINPGRFNAKTKAAISYYKDSGLMTKISKIYYLGDPYPTVVPYSEGGDTQKNNANMVELLGAMAIEHFVSGINTNKEFKFSLSANILVDPVDMGASAARLFLKDFDEHSKKEILKYTTTLAAALKYHHDTVCENRVDTDYTKFLNLGEFDKKMASTNGNVLQDTCASLYQFYTEYQGWLKELDFEGLGDEVPANTHRLALYDMTKDYEELILSESQVVERRSDLREAIIDGVKNVVKKSKSSRPKVTTDLFNSTMNHYFMNHCENNRVSHRDEQEFVFMNILRNAAIEIEEKLNN